MKVGKLLAEGVPVGHIRNVRVMKGHRLKQFICRFWHVQC